MSPETEEEVVEEGEPVEPIGHVRVVYLGPVAPHWEVQSDYGPPEVIDQFRDRVLARLVLLPPHDPQFRRNSERVVRDAEREQLALEWVLDWGDEAEAESARRPGPGPGPACWLGSLAGPVGWGSALVRLRRLGRGRAAPKLHPEVPLGADPRH